MTQFQFEMICKVLQSGAPVLAKELCDSLNNLVVERNQMAKELEGLKTCRPNSDENCSMKQEHHCEEREG